MFVGKKKGPCEFYELGQRYNLTMSEEGGAAPAAGGGGAAAPGASAAPAGGSTFEAAAAQSKEAGSAAVTVEMGGTPPVAERFQDKLADEFKANPALKDFKDINALTKSYLETKALVGKQKVGIPAKDAKAEDVAAFYKELGVPEKAEGYEFKAPEKLPKGVTFNEEEAKGFAEFAKGLNLTKDQAHKLQAWDIDRKGKEFGGSEAAAATKDADFDKVMTERYGDETKQNAVIDKAADMIGQYAGKEVVEQLKKLPAKELMAVSSLLYDIHQKNFAEGKMPGRSGSEGGGTALTLAQAQAELRTIQSGKAYNSPLAEGKQAHDDAMGEAKRLSQYIANLQNPKK